MNSRATILCVGDDAMLLQTRAWVLGCQFEVTSAKHLREIVSAAETYTFQLIVLCHTLSAERHQEVCTLVTALWPKVKLLNISSTDAGGSAGNAPNEIFCMAGPQKLLEKVAEMLALPEVPPTRGTAAHAPDWPSTRTA